jgi:hypothetical protein
VIPGRVPPTRHWPWLTGFISLFGVNALTYLVYACVLVAVVRDGARPEPVRGGYRLVLRDRVPVASLAEGRRRAVTMALAAAIFFGACLLVIAAGASTGTAYLALVAAAIAVGVGSASTRRRSCRWSPISAAGLRGRSMASIGFCWWIGLALSS